MGYLTTLTVYNDGIADLEAHKEEFADGVIAAMKNWRQEAVDVGVGSFVNCVRVQPARHADDHTVYVHRGNCVVEIRPYGDATRELARRNPGFARDVLKQLQQVCKDLKVMLAELSSESSSSR